MLCYQKSGISLIAFYSTARFYFLENRSLWCNLLHEAEEIFAKKWAQLAARVAKCLHSVANKIAQVGRIWYAQHAS